MWGSWFPFSWDLSMQVSSGLVKVKVYPNRLDHPGSRYKPLNCQLWELVPETAACVALGLGLGCGSWPLPGFLALPPPLLQSDQGPVQSGPGHHGLWLWTKRPR